MSLKSAKSWLSDSPSTLYLLKFTHQIARAFHNGFLVNNISTLKGSKYQQQFTTNILHYTMSSSKQYLNLYPLEATMIQFYVLLNSVPPRTKSLKFSPKGPQSKTWRSTEINMVHQHETRIINDLCFSKLDLNITCKDKILVEFEG